MIYAVAVIALVVFAAGLFAVRFWLRKHAAGRIPCPECGTFMSTDGTCPNCGAVATASVSASERKAADAGHLLGKPASVSSAGASRPAAAGSELAARSMAESLRLSFGLLRVIMIGMVVVFALSGFYDVDEGSVAVHLRLGSIRGEPGTQVVEPGGPYFALPSPIDEVLRVPTTLREVAVSEAFWFGGGSADAHVWRALTPGVDGSLITGDKNIVHGRWIVSYRVPYDPKDADRREAPILFVHSVGSAQRADDIVRCAAEQAIVRVVSRTTVENFVRGDIDNDAIRACAQQTLDRLRTGILMDAVSQRTYTVPLRVLPDFQAVNKAESEKALSIENAARFRAETLNEVAGGNHEVLLDAIDEYSGAARAGDLPKARAAEQLVSRLLMSADVGGQVAEIISEAKTYRTEVVEYVRAAAGRFDRLVDQHEKTPRIIRDRMRRDAIQNVLSGDVETFYLPPGDKVIYLETDRDNEGD